MTDRKNGLTYADSGVDIDAGNRLVDLIKPMVRATARAGADAEIGFGRLLDFAAFARTTCGSFWRQYPARAAKVSRRRRSGTSRSA